MKKKKIIQCCIHMSLIFAVCFAVLVNHAVANAGGMTPDGNLPIVIVLDPGHGGEENGACYYGYKEKDLNLRLAKMVKQELEKYADVRVVLTRTEDETISLSNRADVAKQEGADILISIHFNASSSHQSQGASVFISTSELYRKDQQELADCILGEFEAIGLDNAGTFARVTQMNGRRADGTFDDYYGIIRHAYNNNMPGMIIEHGYMDSPTDIKYIKQAGGLEKLALADANGIAAYYGLVKEDGTKTSPKHTSKFMATTKGMKYDYYNAPVISSISLIRENHKTPETAVYEISVEDELGISYIYLVYENSATRETITVPMLIEEPLKTGTYEIEGLVPYGISLGKYRLCYIGAYNLAGYDAGYNYDADYMVGFGKCDWLNSFEYYGNADLSIDALCVVEKNSCEAKLQDTYERIYKEKTYKIWLSQ